MKLVFENYHEAFTWWAPNYYDLQKYEIEISLECKFYFLLHVGCDMTEEIALVKKKIYDDIVVIKAETLYDPDSLENLTYQQVQQNYSTLFWIQSLVLSIQQTAYI